MVLSRFNTTRLHCRTFPHGHARVLQPPGLHAGGLLAMARRRGWDRGVWRRAVGTKGPPKEDGCPSSRLRTLARANPSARLEGVDRRRDRCASQVPPENLRGPPVPHARFPFRELAHAESEAPHLTLPTRSSLHARQHDPPTRRDTPMRDMRRQAEPSASVRSRRIIVTSVLSSGNAAGREPSETNSGPAGAGRGLHPRPRDLRVQLSADAATHRYVDTSSAEDAVAPLLHAARATVRLQGDSEERCQELSRCSCWRMMAPLSPPMR